MDGPPLGRVHGTHIVHRLSDDVHHAAERFISDRHFDPMPQAHGLHTAHHTISGLQRDSPNAAFPDMLRHFDHHVDRHGRCKAFTGDVYRGVDHRDLMFGELNVDGRSGHLDYFAFHQSVGCCHKCPFRTQAIEPVPINLKRRRRSRFR